jgi:nitroreductase
MTATARPASAVTPAPDVVRRLVGLATCAPSVHNTQPWRWRAQPSAGVLELRADRTRQLQVADPQGRNLVISCGAALHHAQQAARALGWSSTVERLPEGPHSDMLARIHLLAAGAPRDAAEVVATLQRRFTDRRRFTSWPVSTGELLRLAAEAEAWGTRAVPLVDTAQRTHAETLVHRALEVQEASPTLAVEQRSWMDRAAKDGVPHSVLPLPEDADDRSTNRFAPLIAGVRSPAVTSTDGLLVLCAGEDEPLSWLRGGEGLSALWLAATTVPLSIVPLSQVVEVPETRRELGQLLPSSSQHPLVLVRVGWQAITFGRTASTSRRPVEDVLRLV